MIRNTQKLTQNSFWIYLYIIYLVLYFDVKDVSNMLEHLDRYHPVKVIVSLEYVDVFS